jgi:hypothetical protein
MDELFETQVQLAAAPADTVTLSPDPEATPAQKALRERWLSAQWP